MMLEMIMLSLLLKVATTIESRLSVVYKNLSTRSNTPMEKRTRMFMSRAVEWGHNLELALYLIY